MSTLGDRWSPRATHLTSDNSAPLEGGVFWLKLPGTELGRGACWPGEDDILRAPAAWRGLGGSSQAFIGSCCSFLWAGFSALPKSTRMSPLLFSGCRSFRISALSSPPASGCHAAPSIFQLRAPASLSRPTAAGRDSEVSLAAEDTPRPGAESSAFSC